MRMVSLDDGVRGGKALFPRLLTIQKIKSKKEEQKCVFVDF